MSWNDAISGELPAPRDDEPSSLRDDILAELRDHLECSAARAQAQGREPDAAVREALDAFGDPATVARQLWFDAMKGKLMSQKISLGLMAVMACVCLGALVIAWKMWEQSQQVNLAVLDRLANLQNTPAGPTLSRDWNPFRVKVVFKEIYGPPVPGIVVMSSDLPVGDGRTIEVNRKTDKEGIVDFGVVRPGAINLNIFSPWGEQNWRRVAILPGTSHEELVILPTTKPETGDVDIAIDLPQPMRGGAFSFYTEFVDPGREFAGQRWLHIESTTRLQFDSNGHRIPLDTPPGTAASNKPEPLVWQEGVWKMKILTMQFFRPVGGFTYAKRVELSPLPEFTVIAGQKNHFNISLSDQQIDPTPTGTSPVSP